MLLFESSGAYDCAVISITPIAGKGTCAFIPNKVVGHHRERSILLLRSLLGTAKKSKGQVERSLSKVEGFKGIKVLRY